MRVVIAAFLLGCWVGVDCFVFVLIDCVCVCVVICVCVVVLCCCGTLLYVVVGRGCAQPATPPARSVRPQRRPSPPFLSTHTHTQRPRHLAARRRRRKRPLAARVAQHDAVELLRGRRCGGDVVVWWCGAVSIGVVSVVGQARGSWSRNAPPPLNRHADTRAPISRIATATSASHLPPFPPPLLPPPSPPPLLPISPTLHLLHPLHLLSSSIASSHLDVDLVGLGARRHVVRKAVAREHGQRDLAFVWVLRLGVVFG